MKYDEAFQWATASSANHDYIVYKWQTNLVKNVLDLENQVLVEPLSAEFEFLVKLR